MKDVGVVRRVDELGRITLPVELRKYFDLEERDELHIFVEGSKIILEKFEPTDLFTCEPGELYDYKGKKVSKESIIALTKLAGLIE